MSAIPAMPTLEPAQRRALRDTCRRLDADVFFAAQFLPASQRPALYAVTVLAGQLLEILTADESCDGHGGCGSACSNSAKSSCATAVSSCSSGGGGGCGGFANTQKRQVCEAVLEYVWKGELTGKADLDAASALLRAGQWPMQPWQQFCDGVLGLESATRLATWRRLREWCEQEAAVMAGIVAGALGGDSGESPQRTAWATALRLPRLLACAAEHWRHGRLLIPLDDLVQAGLGERDIARFSELRSSGGDPRWQQFMQQQAQRVASLYRGGAAWLQTLPSGPRRALAVYGELQLAWFESWLRQGGDPFAGKIVKLTTWKRVQRVPVAMRLAMRG